MTIINIKFNSHDVWIGAYWKTEKSRMYKCGKSYDGKWIELWICLIPCFPIYITFFIKRRKK